jgi:hypothetical protein
VRNQCDGTSLLGAAIGERDILPLKMHDGVTGRPTLRVAYGAGRDINIAAIVGYLPVVCVPGKERRDGACLHNLAPLFYPWPGIIFPNLERIIMLENDDALSAR